jgi:hypothetical protein
MIRYHRAGEEPMKDLTVMLVNKPGTLADAFEALGGAGINVMGACGFPAGGEGVLHVLVEEADAARRALEDAGLHVRAEREVVVLDRLPSRPGTAGEVLRRIADRGVNVDLVYLTDDGRPVLSGEDVAALETAARS